MTSKMNKDSQVIKYSAYFDEIVQGSYKFTSNNSSISILIKHELNYT